MDNDTCKFCGVRPVRRYKSCADLNCRHEAERDTARKTAEKWRKKNPHKVKQYKRTSYLRKKGKEKYAKL